MYSPSGKAGQLRVKEGKSMTEDPIQQVREFISKHRVLPTTSIGAHALLLLSELCDYAEKWQAMLIEATARRNFNHDYPTLPFVPGTIVSEDGSGYDSYMQQAASELVLDASNWRKIGPEEQAAIQEAIYAISHDAMRCTQAETKKRMERSIAVLRKLL